jgi:hypothetical protein
MRDAQIDDDDLFDTIYDDNGKPCRILRDRAVYRVPMHFQDAVQRAIGDERIVGMDGDPFALHKPGPRYVADDSLYDAAEQARQEMIAFTADRWRRGPQFSQTRERNDAGPPEGAYGPVEPHRLGQPCMINGEGGALVASADGKWLLCQPSRRSDSMQVTDAEAIKQRAYDEMCQRLCNPWRHAGPA